MAGTINVVAAVTLDGSRVLCFRRNAGKSAGGLWEFPGGKVHPNESSRAALRRELQEETGRTPVVGRFLLRRPTLVDGTVINISFFETSFDQPSGVPTASSDHDKIEWVQVGRLGHLAWAKPDIPMVTLIERSRIRLRMGNKFGSGAPRIAQFAL